MARLGPAMPAWPVPDGGGNGRDGAAASIGIAPGVAGLRRPPDPPIGKGMIVAVIVHVPQAVSNNT